jgi:hypothetical protein
MARFSTDFLAIPTSAMRMGRLPCGAAADTAIPADILSCLQARFTISADTAGIIGDLLKLPEAPRLAA